MKKILVVLVVVFLFVVFAIRPVEARGVASLENGNLVVSEVREIKRIPGVPEGISAEDAYKLVTGELDKVTIKAKKGKKTVIFGFPLQRINEYQYRVISHGPKGWNDSEVIRTETNTDDVLTFLWLIVPYLGILIVSLVSHLSGKKTRKLFVFYGSILVSILVGASIGLLFNKIAGESLGGLAGLLAGALAGVFAGILAGELAGGLAGIFAGGLAGIFAGMSAGAVAGKQGYEVLIPYFVFLVAACAACLVIAYASGFVKKRLPAIKEWLES